MLQIEQVSVLDLVEYENNVKIHTEKQVKKIADSIKQFGMNAPIGVDENNVLIYGHGRLAACKLLGMTEVPCIRLEHLTEQQKKAYILADNKLNMETGFNLKELEKELKNITDFNMEDFGFKLDFEVPDWKDITQVKTFGFENFEKMYDVQSEGKYDIPIIQPVYELPEIKEWQGFNYVLSDKSPEGKGVHFFVHDYQFVRCWNSPDRYIEHLKKYGAVLSPDFSPYADMPKAMSIYNHYRKHWLAAYWQKHGITVIPTITWSSEETLDFCFDGEPKGGIVAVSTVGIMKNSAKEYKKLFYKAWDIMLKRLKPKQILLYGNPIKYLEGNIVNIESFTQRRWGK